MNVQQAVLRAAVQGSEAPVTPFAVRATALPGSTSAANASSFWTPTDVAWAAGFLDGDGCITATWQVRKDRPNPNMRIQVALAQNDHWTLQQFQQIVGAHGKIYPHKRRAYHNRQCWVLIYWGSHALDVLRALEPYLRRKRQEARLCLAFEKIGCLSVHPGCNGHSTEIWKLRRQFFEKLKRLK